MIDDEQSSVADDAVSNHSDDTAIDESEGARANGQELSGEEHPAQTLAGEHSEANVERGDEQKVAEAESAEVEDEQVAVAPRGPIEETPEEEEAIHMDWFILKVQSNRERTIAEALERKMKIEGYERFFD